MTGILIYQLRWRLHMAVASAWFTSHVLPICVEGGLLCVSLTCTLLTPAMWVSAHTMQFSATAAGCPAIPLHSDTNWSQCRLHRLWAQSPRTALLPQMAVCVPGCHWGFWPTCYKAQVSRLLSWGSVICTRAHRILGNTYLHLLIYYVIKDVMKEADDQPDKERWGEVWRVLSTEACIPRELGCTCLWPHGCAQQTWKRTKLKLRGFLWGLHWGGTIIDWISALSPLPRGGGVGLKVPSFSRWLALFVISPHHAALQEPSRSCLITTEVTCHPGNSEGFRSSVLGTGVKVQIREGKVLQVALSSKRLQEFQEFCVRNRVQSPVIYFLWFHTILWNTVSLHSIWRN